MPGLQRERVQDMTDLPKVAEPSKTEGLAKAKVDSLFWTRKGTSCFMRGK